MEEPVLRVVEMVLVHQLELVDLVPQEAVEVEEVVMDLPEVQEQMEIQEPLAQQEILVHQMLVALVVLQPHQLLQEL
jgi:hypothetical protein